MSPEQILKWVFLFVIVVIVTVLLFKVLEMI